MREEWGEFLLGILVGALVVVMFTLSAPTPCRADTWGVISGLSYHTDRSVKHNEVNPGLGVEIDMPEPDTRVIAGFYKNSEWRQTVYAGASWTPWHFGRYVKAGMAIGIATGYQPQNLLGLTPIGAAVLSVEGDRVGANVMALPPVGQYPGVFGLQVKAKF